MALYFLRQKQIPAHIETSCQSGRLPLSALPSSSALGAADYSEAESLNRNGFSFYSVSWLSVVTERHWLWLRDICMSQANGSLLCSTDWMTCGGWGGGGGGQRELKEGEPSASLRWVMMCSILPSLWEALGWVSTSQQSRPSNSACSGPQPPPHSAHTYNTHTCSLALLHSFTLSILLVPFLSPPWCLVICLPSESHGQQFLCC